MNVKHKSMTLGAVASALLLSGLAASSASADAGAAAHAWNDSNSVDECLAAAGNDFTADAIMWNCETQGGQEWSVLLWDYQDDSYVIGNNNGSCLGIAGDSQGEGAQVVAESCSNGDASQYWQLFGGVYPSSDFQGYTEYQNVASGYCLSVAGGSLGNGATVIQWRCQGTPDQEWDFSGGVEVQ